MMDNETLYALDDEMTGAIGVMLDDDGTPPTLWTIRDVYSDWYLLESSQGYAKCDFRDFWQLL